MLRRDGAGIELRKGKPAPAAPWRSSPPPQCSSCASSCSRQKWRRGGDGNAMSLLTRGCGADQLPIHQNKTSPAQFSSRNRARDTCRGAGWAASNPRKPALPNLCVCVVMVGGSSPCVGLITSGTSSDYAGVKSLVWMLHCGLDIPERRMQ